jgi:hypothetical protein
VAGTRSKNAIQSGSGIYGPGNASGSRMGGVGTNRLMNALSVSGNKNVASGIVGIGHNVSVLDDEGNDVTPVSLMGASKGAFMKLAPGIDGNSLSSVAKVPLFPGFVEKPLILFRKPSQMF